jgi:hypothetical protein
MSPLGAGFSTEADQRLVLRAADELEQATVRLDQGERVEIAGDIAAGLCGRHL